MKPQGRVDVIALPGWQVPLEGKLKHSSVMEQNGVIYLNNDSFLGDKAISLLGGIFFPMSPSLLGPGMKVVCKGRQC